MTSLVDEHTLFVSVSRSGERGWVVDALKESIRQGANGVAVTGMPDSLLAQNVQYVLTTSEGPEITFAKTKSVATCSGLLIRLALGFAKLDDLAAQKQLEVLRSTPELIRDTITFTEAQIKALISELRVYKIVIVAGTISDYGTALEFAIKLQEAANIPVIGNDTGNMLHGPWRPINENWLAVLLITGYDLELCKKNTTIGRKPQWSLISNC
jgi:glucosamine--fructose-6-phosphate aminotransferase (isomerizing)